MLAKWREYEDVAAFDWLNRYAGRTTAESLWQPMLKVKFGPYADRVPLAWLIGRLRQRMNSRKRGAEKLGYLRGSLSTLLDALLAELKRLDVTLIANAPVTKCRIESGTMTSLKTTDDEFVGGDFLFTVPSPVIAKLLAESQPAEAAKHAAIEYFGAICVVLEMSAPLGTVYWLNVADPDFPFGGVIEQTNMIPASEYNGSHIAYLSRYVTKDEPLWKMTDAEVEETMLAALRRMHPELTADRLKKFYVFRTATAATVCDLNFSRRVPECHTSINRMYVANMCHIYPDERSVNNSIRVATEACRVMGTLVDDVPRSSSLSAQIGFNVPARAKTNAVGMSPARERSSQLGQPLATSNP
jgi:protoporphyrinogen oxidase